MSGLSAKDEVKYLRRLATSERLHEEAEKISEERKGYSQIIKNMASDFGKALKEKIMKNCLPWKKLPKSMILNIMRLKKCVLSILHWRLKT